MLKSEYLDWHTARMGGVGTYKTEFKIKLIKEYVLKESYAEMTSNGLNINNIREYSIFHNQYLSLS